MAWGDYDNDGRLDLLLAGAGNSQLWRNTGSGFTNVTASAAPSLSGVANSSLAWGDYDGDGRLDFALSGYFYAYDATTLPDGTIVFSESGIVDDTDAGAAGTNVWQYALISRNDGRTWTNVLVDKVKRGED